MTIHDERSVSEMPDPVRVELLTRVGERIADEVEKVAAGRQSNCEQAARDIAAMFAPTRLKRKAASHRARLSFG